MELKSIVKYNINSMKSSIAIYYSFFIIQGFSLISLSWSVNRLSSGVEISTAIFLFVLGLNIFKKNFYFIKSNNVTRKNFIYGEALSMILVVLFMSVIDIIINRILNIFMKSPTIYEMIYTNFVNDDQWVINTWVQSNSIETLLNTFTYQFTMYLALFSLGFLITIIYYKSNKLMKLVVSFSPVSIIIVFNIIIKFPRFSSAMGIFIGTIFGWINNNSYAAVLTFIILFMIFIGISRLLTRKAVIK